jgi:hypothetical protein
MLTFKEQLEELVKKNYDEFPDAVKWIMNMTMKEDISLIKTDYEKFIFRLSHGFGDFEGHPFKGDNIVELIKWYRNKTGLGLKESKEKCDEFRARYYPR